MADVGIVSKLERVRNDFRSLRNTSEAVQCVAFIQNHRRASVSPFALPGAFRHKHDCGIQSIENGWLWFFGDGQTKSAIDGLAEAAGRLARKLPEIPEISKWIVPVVSDNYGPDNLRWYQLIFELGQLRRTGAPRSQGLLGPQIEGYVWHENSSETFEAWRSDRDSLPETDWRRTMPDPPDWWFYQIKDLAEFSVTALDFLTDRLREQAETPVWQPGPFKLEYCRELKQIRRNGKTLELDKAAVPWAICMVAIAAHPKQFEWSDFGQKGLPDYDGKNDSGTGNTAVDRTRKLLKRIGLTIDYRLLKESPK